LCKQDPDKARKMLDNWFAIDIYPEYKKEFSEVLKFIREMHDRNLQILLKLIEKPEGKIDKF
jgi:hypothetical protein